MCAQHPGVTEGKMMSSPAIHFNSKVFAFFSRKNKMVFRLGKNYPEGLIDVELVEFSPFKTKKPLSGWYEVHFDDHKQWERLAAQALELIKKRSG